MFILVNPRMNITNLCNDMFTEIHRHLPTSQLVQLTSVNSKYNHLIKNTVWPHATSDKRYLIAGYKFRNYTLRITANTKDKYTQTEYRKLQRNLNSNCNVTLSELLIDRKLLKSLRRVRKLRFVQCTFDDLSDKDYMWIRNVPVIKIIGCKRVPLIYLKRILINNFAPVKITCEMVPFLPNIPKLDLSLCDKGVSKKYGTMPNVTKVNFRASFKRIKDLDKLTHVTDFDLTQCDVTVDDFRHITQAKSMTLGMDHQMKDDGISYLVNLTYLSIGPDDSFVGTAFKYLTKLITVVIDCCPVNENNFVYLRNVKYLTLEMCAHISDSGLAHLKNLSKLELLSNDNVTDDGLGHLSNINELVLESCYGITDKGMIHLANVPKLKICRCGRITGSGLKYLTNVKRLSLNDNSDFDGQNLSLLPPVDKLYLTYCPLVENEDLRQLSHVGVLGIHECDEIDEHDLPDLPNVNKIRMLQDDCY